MMCFFSFFFYFYRSRSSLDGGAEMGDSPLPLDPPRMNNTREAAKEGRKEDDQLTVSQLSPSKTVRMDGKDVGVPIAVSPMGPSKKRVSSAGQESDNEPDGAWLNEWEKPKLISQSNLEGSEVRMCGEGKGAQEMRRSTEGGKSLGLRQASHQKVGKASNSLTLTRRLKAKSVNESPRVRKLKDKLLGRVVAGGRRRSGIKGVSKTSRGGRSDSHACEYPENVGGSTSTGREGTDRTWSRQRMPYGGDDNVSFGSANSIFEI